MVLLSAFAFLLFISQASAFTFSGTYGTLVFLAFIPLGLVLGFFAALAFWMSEWIRKDGDLSWKKVLFWGFLLWLMVFMCTVVVGAAAVKGTYIHAALGFFLIMTPMTAFTWLMLHFTAENMRVRNAEEVALVGANDGPLTTPANHKKESVWSLPKRRFLAFVVTVLVVFIFALLCLWLRDTCWYSSPSGVSVWLMRQNLPQNERCDFNGGAPCHVLFTLSQSHNEFVVNFHNRRDPNELFSSNTLVPTVEWGTTSGNYTWSRIGSWHQYEGVADSYVRNLRIVSWCYLDFPSPDTTYYVRVSLGGNIWSSEYKIRSLPASSTDLRFVVGGDTGFIQQPELHTAAAASEPHVAFHGGDIAYANGMHSCYPRWDEWLYNWENFMATPMGYSVPISLAIGNHEAGGFDKLPEDAPWYPLLFAQEPGIMDIASRKSFHVHEITLDTVLFVLDSDVIARMDGEQMQWFVNALQMYSDFPIKKVIYHAPLYPSVRVFSTRESALGRQHWLPIFDQYNITVAYENHDHYYKRTFPLREGVPVLEGGAVRGTFYLGDGCWGTTPRDPRMDTSRDGLFAKRIKSQYVLLGHGANSTGLSYTAVDATAAIIDEFVVPI